MNWNIVGLGVIETGKAQRVKQAFLGLDGFVSVGHWLRVCVETAPFACFVFSVRSSEYDSSV